MYYVGIMAASRVWNIRALAGQEMENESLTSSSTSLIATLNRRVNIHTPDMAHDVEHGHHICVLLVLACHPPPQKPIHVERP